MNPATTLPPSTPPFQAFSQDFWERFWEGRKLPQVVRLGSIPDQHAILQRFLPPAEARATLLEVGCAPGRWLNYFHAHFGCAVSGLDYAPEACEATRQNLALLDTPSEIFCADAFDFRREPPGFEIVLSLGLVEHFADLDRVIRQIVSFARPDGGLVITVVPNLYGLHGRVMKRVRPREYAGHVPISLAQLTSVHEANGTETLFANYVGGWVIPLVFRGTRFARRHPRASRLVHLPLMFLNRLAQMFCVATGRFPRSPFWSPMLMYVGRKIPGRKRPA
jgi:SAM-dependent methyltransferase